MAERKTIKSSKVTIDPTMDKRVAQNDPYIIAKVKRAREILEKAGYPKSMRDELSRGDAK